VAGVTACADLEVDDAARARTVVDAVQARVGPADLGVLQLSGGTTGTPKLIPRLHAEYWFNAVAYARRLGWSMEDRVAYIGPVVHNAGIVCGVHGPHSIGATAVLGAPDTGEALFALLERTAATDIVLGPFAYDVALAPELTRARGLRRVLFSGKKVPERHFARLRDLGVWSGQLFGMGEGLCMITPIEAPEEVRLTTVGTPLSELDEVRLLEPDGEREVPVGTVGELCARGPYTIRGYLGAPDRNAQAFTHDGFYRTGDLAAERVVDGVSHYSIEGRIKDLINRGGEKINAEELELLLVSHPGIREAALVAMPDPRLGERACAFLVAVGEPLDMAEVRRHLGELGVAKYKWPERLVWMEALPRRSAVGKIDKSGLRERAGTLTAEPR
jgi:2,3-dihydroxybenzoate-AMP ligase